MLLSLHFISINNKIILWLWENNDVVYDEIYMYGIIYEVSDHMDKGLGKQLDLSVICRQVKNGQISTFRHLSDL